MELSNIVSVAPRFSRSISIERDSASPSALEGYIVTSTGREVLERIGSSLSGVGHKAWNITGAYGSGKSAFALFAGHLLGGENTPCSTRARQLLHEQEPDLYRTLFDKRRATRLADAGYCVVFATGATQPISERLLVAAVRDIDRQWSGKPNGALTELRQMRDRLNRGKAVSSTRLVELLVEFSENVRKSARFSGLVLVLDELGKCLEYAARNPSSGDVYILQQLAEATQDSGLCIFTILHQSFERYAAALSTRERDEWAKVQGRFEEIAFQESPEQLIRLLSNAITHSESADSKSLRREARVEAERAYELGLTPPGMSKHDFVESLVQCAPLHPVTVMALVRLCNKLGQHHRSLFAFLTSREPYSFSNFISEASGTSFYRVHDLFDYVSAAMGSGLSIGENASRWAEVQSALDRALEFSAEELDAIKAVGLLSAIGEYGNLKPSVDILAFSNGEQVKSSLRQLNKSSVVVYRKHSESYALWQGSDVDLNSRTREAKRRVTVSDLPRVVSLNWSPRPLVAKRHSYITGTLRFFEVRFANTTNFVSAIEHSADSDGVLVYCLPSSTGEREELRELLTSGPVKQRLDVVIALPRDVDALASAVAEVECLRWVETNTPELNGDSVGRRELQARKLSATARLGEEIGKLFSPEMTTSSSTTWFHKGLEHRITGNRSLSSFLSDICDFVYSATPVLRNELLNRRYLSSAAAAARRNLIDAMLNRGDKERLGFEGTPPEVSMYASILESNGIHRLEDGEWRFSTPPSDSSVSKAWSAVENFLDQCELKRQPVSELFEALQRPPLGLKMGVIPVLVCASLLSHDADVAVYENDAFIPELSIEVFERLLRSPERFTLKHYKISGVRREVFRSFAALLNSPDSVAENIVSVVRPIFRFINKLPEFTKRTKRLSDNAVAVREALLSSREPDALLFSELPIACGFEPFAPQSTDERAVTKFFSALRTCLTELQRAYDELLINLQSSLYSAFDPSFKDSLRPVLRFRAQQILDHAADSRLKAFLHHLADEELEDVAWIEAIATLLVGKPPKSWNDADRSRFEVNLVELVRSFRRIEVLVFEKTKRRVGEPQPAEILRIGVTDSHTHDIETVVAVAPVDSELLGAAVIQIENTLEQMKLGNNPVLALAALGLIARRLIPEVSEQRKETTSSGATQHEHIASPHS